MFERNIDENDIMEVISHGKIIQSYPNDQPYPSYLILGFSNELPLHVLIGHNSETNECYVVTTYHPDKNIWNVDFQTRRRS
ncbi:MAG: DUF4258 domain-containing protein [Desulfamplus sp.]|nr:DUF4258 domain-containing protein [Desulfamplus sp.]